MAKKGKRSPFPRPSLPQAGESLGETAMDLFYDWFFIAFTMAITVTVVAALDWFYWWMDLRRPQTSGPTSILLAAGQKVDVTFYSSKGGCHLLFFR